jgi:hypothetical protein
MISSFPEHLIASTELHACQEERELTCTAREQPKAVTDTRQCPSVDETCGEGLRATMAGRSTCTHTEPHCPRCVSEQRVDVMDGC